ncbi:desulfoferrodoxin [Moorella sulfitireducens (nom. illeg.)]|uniref:desulfoferrodoxin n=1 Tax=Neomoorella sulfitireducens TaxID=2972948 RepID=UPI0021AD24EB|nr:desulfoferrodoxin [Moorella sulfitireducens]
MTISGQVYKCGICGNIVEVLHAGRGALVCCGKPMELLAENTVDASREKHVPVVEKIDGGFKVTVGSTAHPMEEKHYIEWIELRSGGLVLRRHLEPGAAPEAVFCTEVDNVSAYAFCNLHGLWKS